MKLKVTASYGLTVNATPETLGLWFAREDAEVLKDMLNRADSLGLKVESINLNIDNSRYTITAIK